MRILWFNGGLLPEAAEAIGYSRGVTAGWLGALQEALVRVDPDIKMCCLSLDRRKCDITIGNVRHVSFGVGQWRSYYKKVPCKIEQFCKKVISEFNPDLIHVHGTEYFYGRMSADVYCGKPVVVSLQGILSAIHVQYCGGLSPKETWWTKFNCRLLRYGTTLFKEQTFWREQRAVQEAQVFRMHKYFIGRTEWDKAWTEFYNHKATYFHVNETLRAPFYAAQRIRSKIFRYTIYCGAASSYPLKGAHWLFRAIASLKEEFPDIQLRIAAAKGRLSTNRSMWERLKDDAYAMYLRRLIRELGIEKNIMLLPALSAEAVAEELKTCELFVLPSLCENSPNSLGEAMLVGTPSIATYVGGTPSILKDGVEGKLVPSGDAAALASAIRHWFRCPDDADACVAPAREVAIERHNAEKNVRETLTVYREIIKREAKEE